MKVHVTFFAAFREQAGQREATLSTDAATVGDLFEELRATRPALERYPAMKFAVNDELVSAEATLADDDRVLFFPPVAGG